ncbi:LOW QUALITY PROTEIN: E3 ubiquitin-protein ligase ZSWIM2 [Phoenicopterus ruber ruber]
MAAVPLPWGRASEAVVAVGRARLARGGSGRWPRAAAAGPALSSTMRLVRELGPTAFLLREEGRDGPPLRMQGTPRGSLPGGAFAGDAFKLGRLERETEDVLQQLHQEQTKKKNFSRTLHQKNDRCIDRKEIDEEDVCPICQEELLKKMLPITYCRLSIQFTCGNNIHIKWMKIWPDHQDELEIDCVVKCPLCREKFAPLRLILEEFRNSKQLVTAAEKTRLDRHLGIPCSNHRVFPIVGKCYKCTECVEYHLCHECFTGFCYSPHFYFQTGTKQVFFFVSYPDLYNIN